MHYFNKDFNQFFIELASNNNKDWFDANRRRYLENVKNPFEHFLNDLVERIRKQDPAFQIDVPKSIFRINRDIRFSKDKTPYKLNRSAFLSPFGKKDSRPGLYISLGPEKVWVGGGVYAPDKNELMRVRNAIAQRPENFRHAISHKAFVEKYGALRGEENKRLPTKRLTAAAEKQPLIYRKQFYYMAEFPPDTILRRDLVEFVATYYQAAEPVRTFFDEALSR